MKSTTVVTRPFSYTFAALFAFFSLFSVGVARGQADPDLPGAGATFEMVPAGSLVVAMDTNHQALVGPFNLKAYGLVNALLHTNIPVKWAIAAGKSKDGVDFSGRAQRVFPSGQSAAEYTFRGGPFIVHRDFTNRAASVISAFGNQVAVYRLLEDRQIDVRYTVAHKPQVAVLDDGGTDDIQTEILEEAGFPAAHYRVLHAADVAFLPVSSCFTIVTTPHFDGGTTANNQTRAIRDFVKDGGNFLAQCAAVRTYENNGQFGHFHTTRGIMDDDSAKTFDYPHGDMAFNQFQGPLADEGGNLQDWELQAGSVLTNHAYAQVLKAGTANIYRASVAKLQRGKPGSVVFYLGGHNYDGNDIEHYNGRRMYLNALFVPVDRPAECVINFQTDLAVSVDNGVSVVTNGQAVTYTVVVTNRGPGRVLGARVRDVFPGSLGNVSWTSVASGGATNLNPTGTGNIEAMVNLPIGGSVRFTVRATVTAAASGMITNTAAVEVPATMSDSDLSNNQASDVDRVLQGTVIVVPPVDQTNCPQTTATFSVSATGTGLGYQWFYGNNPLAGQTNATLVLNNVSVAQGGIYSVTVSGAVGGPVTRSATLTINSNVVVVTPPSNQTNCAGTLAMFNVNATGSGLTYQWYRDTNLLLGQTNSGLFLTNVSLATAGNYLVVTRGACGVAITNEARLVVNQPVTILVAPTNRTTVLGSNVTFRVEATGTLIRYQWFFNGALIGTNSTLNLNNVRSNQIGQYCSVVSGLCGIPATNCVVLTLTNTAPRAFPDFYNLNEDQTLTVGVPGVLGNDVDNEGNPLTAVLVTGPGRGSLVLQPDGSFVYVPETDFHGTDTFRYKARDGSAESEVVTVTLTVGAVNDAPDFNLGPDQLVNPSTGPYALSGFATGIKAGPANEAGQALTFIVSVDRPELFVGVPTLGLDGTLRYTPGPTPGVAVVSVVLMDDGGRANGGVDRSAVKTFRIRINAPPLVSIVSPTNEAVFVASQNVTIVADAMDTDGVVTNVQFYVGTNLLAQRTSAPYFVVWTNVPAGVYELRARATDDLGLTTTSSVVRIRVIEKLPLTFIGPILYDGNVDLFKQQVRVFNPTPFTLEGARVLVFNLNRPGDRVYNANGTNNGTAFVQFNAPIPPGQSANLTLEYYFPSRVVPSPGPTLVTEIVPPSGPIMLEGQGQRINRTVQFPVNQTFLIDFTSILNRSYAVQYSSDLVTWKTVVPTIIGTGANVQWVDNGAPKTESAPAVTEKRFYRVILLP